MTCVNEEDRAYFYHRASVQIELAEKSENAAAVSAHIALAEEYMALCDADALLAAARAEHDGLRPIAAD